MVWFVGFAGLVGGLVVAAAGLYMMRWGRTAPSVAGSGADSTAQGALATVLEHLSLASRYMIGFCLVVLGYHLVSYSLPQGWLWLRVPPERLWIMGVAMAVGVGGSLMVDAVERR